MSTRFRISSLSVMLALEVCEERKLGMRCMIVCFKFGILLGLLLSVLPVIKALDFDGGYEQCENIVEKWASSSIHSEVKDNKHALRDLLFFLHVPRTGGRTYLHCFLKKLYSKSQECPRSYDKLRFDPRKSNCRLLSTHDDYSIISKLPLKKTSVVTILRDPIERVFSTYEFSIEVASRFLIHPNITSVSRIARLAHARRKRSGLSTLDIWPWKYLVPWMREDLFARRDARELKGQTNVASNNSYDMEDIVMPLHEYINDPIAREIVHNGATFQIAGLTNNSYIAESHDVRHCVRKYQTLGEHVLQVAKKRLDEMLYVGLTESHKESATMFANVVGAQVLTHHTVSSSSSDDASNNDSEQRILLPDARSDAHDQGNVTVVSSDEDEAIHKSFTAEKLMREYEICMLTLRNTQAERRVNSLKRISPANFTKEGRKRVSGELVHKIASLNSLDVELYKYAQYLFKKQQARLTESIVKSESSSIFTASTAPYPSSSRPPWKFMSLAIMSVALLFIFLFLNSRRRTFKVKL